MKLGKAVKGEEVVVFEGNGFEQNVVTIITENAYEDVFVKRVYGSDVKVTLEDIKTMCEERGYYISIITVIVENPLEGVIYQYGNSCDDTWYIHGKTEGYA